MGVNERWTLIGENVEDAYLVSIINIFMTIFLYIDEEQIQKWTKLDSKV